MGKIIKFIIIAFVALAILGAAAFWGLAGFFAPKDMEESLIPDAASQFFDINGRVISTTASEERRLPVAFDKIPKHLQQAFIAIEDNRFYEHGGIDFRGTARALWTNLRGGEVQQLYVCARLVSFLREVEKEDGIQPGKSVMIVPTAIGASMNEGSRLWEPENMDINRRLPGDPTGSTTERIRHAVLERVKKYRYGGQLTRF